MKMYRCNECGHLFEDGEQAEWVEMHGFNYGNGERFSGCPICKGDYEEIKPCKICGSFNHNIDEKFCNNCKNNFRKELMSILIQNFSKEKTELFNEIYK